MGACPGSLPTGEGRGMKYLCNKTDGDCWARAEGECYFGGPCPYKVAEDEKGKPRNTCPCHNLSKMHDGDYLCLECNATYSVVKTTNVEQNPAAPAPKEGDALDKMVKDHVEDMKAPFWERKSLPPLWAELLVGLLRHRFPYAKVEKWVKDRCYVEMHVPGWWLMWDSEPERPSAEQSLLRMAVSAEYWRRKDRDGGK